MMEWFEKKYIYVDIIKDIFLFYFKIDMCICMNNYWYLKVK